MREVRATRAAVCLVGSVVVISTASFHMPDIKLTGGILSKYNDFWQDYTDIFLHI